MKKIVYGIFLVLLLVGFWAGFYYKDQLLSFYNNVGKNVAQLKNLDTGGKINEIAQQLFAPDPLHIGGSANSVVLTKAKIIAQTNFARFDNGLLPPLTENAKLDAAAMAKAKDMFDKQYFEHVSPSGVNPGMLVKSYGYDYIISGENLILGNFKDEAEVLQDWMNSPGHRANILNNRVVDIGVAVVKGTYKGETVWIGVQEFGLPLAACPNLDIVAKAQIDANMAQLSQLGAQIDAKKAEIEKTNRNSSQYNQLVDQYNALVDQYNQLNQTTKTLISQYNVQVNAFNQCVNGN